MRSSGKAAQNTPKFTERALSQKARDSRQRWELKIPNLLKVGTSGISICCMMIYEIDLI